MDLFDNIPNSIHDLYDLPLVKANELQRTKEWHEQRRGRFTGSKIHELMSCTQSTSKMEWRPEKVIDFGETAKKYVFAKAMERMTGLVIEENIGFNGKYGEICEPQIIALFEEKYPDYKIEKVGFIEFLPLIAGASPDGKINHDYGVEIKAAMSWNGIYERLELPFDQKHKDFWQIQSEMLALDVKEIFYIIGYPAKDLYNPVITEITEKIVKASPIHQNAIIQRCKIGNDAIRLYLNGYNFQEAIRVACTEFEF